MYHSLIWLSAFFVNLYLIWPDSSQLGLGDLMIENVIFMSPIFICINLNWIIKERLFKERSYWLYTLFLGLNILLGIALYWMIERFALTPHHELSMQNDSSNVIFLLLFSTSLQYMKRGFIKQYRFQELKAKSAEIELNFLKAQINPHFLFNTLNNIYATNQIDSEQGSEMILELSDLMRYHLTASKKKFVPLEEEVGLIKSYIKIEELRLRDNCQLIISLPEEASKLMIGPLILLPFIENAFKYGTHSTLPCQINLDLSVNQRELKMQLSNTVFPSKRVIKTNIGLANTQKRLEILYPQTHSLETIESEDQYQVVLKIKL
ncbi:MAG: sensor histidine kinase [Bacteroidia bacterium]